MAVCAGGAVSPEKAVFAGGDLVLVEQAGSRGNDVFVERTGIREIALTTSVGRRRCGETLVLSVDFVFVERTGFCEINVFVVSDGTSVVFGRGREGS